ncbi:hypothetical protein CLU79DRAFT_746927 [Phycomyces nitens]|nr:hypothetical protein CLU79DRAFT_746927 [Phycomyces nitens]
MDLTMIRPETFFIDKQSFLYKNATNFIMTVFGCGGSVTPNQGWIGAEYSACFSIKSYNSVYNSYFVFRMFQIVVYMYIFLFNVISN